MTPQTLLEDLARLGVKVWPSGDELRFGPRERVTVELRERLRKHKAELLEFLTEPALPSPLEPPKLVRTSPSIPLPRECPEAASVRNLLFHFYPLRGSYWLWHVEQLRRLATREIFNGKRVLALALDAETEDAAIVRRELSGLFDDILEVPNDFDLREVASFEALFRSVQSADPREATLYAHGKGVYRLTEPNRPTVKRWTEVLYETCMGGWKAAQELLRTHPIAGPFFKAGAAWFPQSLADWHFSGSWLWFRNRDVFSRDWRKIDRFVYGIETWPALHFSPDEAGRLFYSGDLRLNLYDEGDWRRVESAFAAWQEEQRELPEGLCVELGGGTNSRGGDWINVDVRALPGVAHVCDFERDRLPFPDESVAQLYSAHCFEHVSNLKHLLHEVVRVCKAGARFTMHVPHWMQSMAMCYDHKHTISERQVRHWCEEFVADWFGGCARRLALKRVEYIPGERFHEAKPLFPQLSDEQLMRFVPDCCHEIRFTMEVVQYAS